MFAFDDKHIKLDADERGGSVGSTDPEDVTAEGGDETPDELEGLPLHLHPRGKELVAQKNAARRELDAWKSLGSPDVIAEKLHRLEMWEAADEAETEVKETPKAFTKEQLSEKAERDYARQVLEQLAPEIKEIAELKKHSEEQRAVIQSFRAALADEAWEATQEIAEEIDMDPQALAKLVKPVLQEETRLLRMYNAGKAKESVTEAVKILRNKLAAKADTTITERADKIVKASETKTKLPKTHAPGKSETSVRPDEKPKDFKEAEKRLMSRLERMGM